MHPDEEIDLCAILISELLHSLILQGLVIKHQILGEPWRMSSEEIDKLTPAEPIAMVGYPNGLWDEVNNRPLIRQGNTASHVAVKWNGRREFVIDCACFAGSSGSPVFHFQKDIVATGQGISFGSRAMLIGTLWGGPIVSTQGELVVQPIPTATRTVPVIEQMLNLGFVIHVSALDQLATPVHRRIDEIEKIRSNITAVAALVRSAGAAVYPSRSGIGANPKSTKPD
jgi:hypothetical protein